MSSSQHGSFWSTVRTTALIALVAVGTVSWPISADSDPAAAIPHPDLSHLEPAVATQIEDSRDELALLLTEAGENPIARGRAYGQLGQLYHAYRLDEAAAHLYQLALEQAPIDFNWPYLQGYLAQQTGRLEDAELYYLKSLVLWDASVSARVHLGEVYVGLDRPAEAQLFFRQALEADPGNAAALAGLGEVALSQRRYQEAVEHLEAALETLPDANRLHYPLALAYRGLGDSEKARHHLERRGEVGAKTADPLVAELEDLKRGERVYLLRGRRAFAAGRWAEAAEAFAAAAEANPKAARGRVNLAAALSQLGRRTEAVAELRKAVEISPTSQAAHFNLGSLLHQAGDLQSAATHYREAVELEPGDARARLELSQVLRQLGRTEAAWEQAARAAKLAPESEGARLAEASILVELGRFGEARERLEEGLGLMPESGSLAHSLARLLAASPMLEVRDGERALALAGAVFQALQSAWHAETVALALAELGRCDEAVQWQEKAIELARQNEEQGRLANLENIRQRYLDSTTCRPPSN